MPESEPQSSNLDARLGALEQENRRLRYCLDDLQRTQRRLQWIVAAVFLLILGNYFASRFVVLPWQQIAHFDRVIANRFEVPNQISSEYEFYHNTHDRPDAVFGWVSRDEIQFGQWGGAAFVHGQIQRGDGPGLYIRTPTTLNPAAKQDVKLGVLPGLVSLPPFSR
ncbi:MAG TPA: hypothetical protein VFE62_11690 [Gemmataceae bacterium]|nr:hypothetical protein [Gemmataceae bacterium]